MAENRHTKIETLAGEGDLLGLKELLQPDFTAYELNIALENAVAYSRIETAEYLLSHGADISHNEFQGTYYAVHNNELEGLQFAFRKGVDLNFSKGVLLNASIITAYHEKDTSIFKWLLQNGANTAFLSEDIMNAFGTEELKELIENINQSN